MTNRRALEQHRRQNIHIAQTRLNVSNRSEMGPTMSEHNFALFACATPNSSCQNPGQEKLQILLHHGCCCSALPLALARSCQVAGFMSISTGTLSKVGRITFGNATTCLLSFIMKNLSFPGERRILFSSLRRIGSWLIAMRSSKYIMNKSTSISSYISPSG